MLSTLAPSTPLPRNCSIGATPALFVEPWIRQLVHPASKRLPLGGTIPLPLPYLLQHVESTRHRVQRATTRVALINRNKFIAITFFLFFFFFLVVSALVVRRQTNMLTFLNPDSRLLVARTHILIT